MSPLSNDERRAVLGLARRAIVEAVCHNRILDVPSPSGALATPSGAFVTLHRRGRLCGCIGQIVTTESLAEAVARCAVLAATRDPRFHPVHPEDLGELEIEISVLSPLEPIEPEAIEVGRHGLMVAREQQRGVLLPQVAIEHRWTRERFLEETCAKAGLEPHAWKDASTKVLAFTAEVFSEAHFRAPQQAQAS